MTFVDPTSSDDRCYSYGYDSPVSELIRLGERALRGPAPRDYRAMGITQDHLAELTRMSVDPVFNHDERGDCPEVYAPIHAMRALMQIGAEHAIEPLVRLLEFDNTADYEELNDWFIEEIPEAMARIGAAAIPRLSKLLADQSKHTHSRWAAATALEKIASRNAELRAQCVAVITAQLDRFEQNDPELNGGLVGELLDLHAIESVSSIERAFAADLVDETIAGDWDEVQAELGLRPPLTDQEYRKKALTRESAHGWLTPDEMLGDDEDDLDDWEDAGPDTLEAGDGEDSYSSPDELTEEPDDRPKMFMPEDIYTAEERRQLAKQRKKERKAADKAKTRQKQSKRRR